MHDAAPVAVNRRSVENLPEGMVENWKVCEKHEMVKRPAKT